MKKEEIITTYYGHKSIRIIIYAVISILSFFAFSWFKTVNAATISTNSGTLYEGAWKGNSRDQNAYRLLYDGINGQTSNFAYGNAPFLYVNDIFMSVLNANANESVSYIAEISVCQTNTDYNLNYDSGSVHSQITNIERLRAVKAGGCYVNVYNGNLVNYYFKVTGNVIKYSNPESDYGFDGQEYVLRWTNGTYNEFSVKNVTFTEYTTELYNSIIQANSLDDIKSAIEKQKEDTNNKLDQQINQNQTIIDQNNQTNSKLDEIETMQPDTTETPDDSSYKDYEQSEEELEEYIKQADTSILDVAIDTNTSNFIWDTMTSFIKSNALVFSAIIALLSIGIIKLALNR